MFSSTASTFLLFVSSSEVFVVVVLCVFTAVVTPAWNDTGLLIAELYPTHLRSTAAGIHLLMARIGAILGTNIFGIFIRVNPFVPILLVALLLLVGGVAALILPKTTRRTLLK
jgi:VNT family MFS transporter (synaptic vesicle glycoprotein 2)